MKLTQTKVLTDVSLVKDKLIPNLSTVHQVIVGMSLKSGAKINDLLHFTVGEKRSCTPSLEGMFFYSIASTKGKFMFFLDSDTEQQLSDYCWLERKVRDRNHRNFDELNDGDFVFINRHGYRASLLAVVHDWNKTCQKIGVKIPLNNVHRLWRLNSMKSGVPLSVITKFPCTGEDFSFAKYYSENQISTSSQSDYSI